MFYLSLHQIVNQTTKKIILNKNVVKNKFDYNCNSFYKDTFNSICKIKIVAKNVICVFVFVLEVVR